MKSIDVISNVGTLERQGSSASVRQRENKYQCGIEEKHIKGNTNKKVIVDKNLNVTLTVAKMENHL